jgi:glucose/arabinose dehydrogenase
VSIVRRSEGFKMKLRQEIVPVFCILLFLIIAREIYPYAGVMQARVRDGYEQETIATGLGGPTCLVFDEETLLVCDRDAGRIVTVNGTVLLSGLDHPHGLVLLDDGVVISEEGKLTRYDSNYENPVILVDGIPSGNHQTNAVNLLPNGTLIWHSGSTCNHCDEDDPRNAALLWVNAITGEHGILATGVRNSFDGVWLDGIGYLFSDNGQDAEGGDFPNEEINLLIEGAEYGWLTESADDPNPVGTEAPVATWAPHASVNGMTTRPANLPGGQYTVYATVYGSWATLLPQGHQILKIDFKQTDDGWIGDAEVFAEDVGTPLPITAGPDGNLYYATFDHGGAVHVISPEANS